MKVLDKERRGKGRRLRFQMNQRVRCQFLLDDHILRGKGSMHLNHEKSPFHNTKVPGFDDQNIDKVASVIDFL